MDGVKQLRLPSLLAALLLVGCGGTAKGDPQSTRRSGKDRGAASMTLGSTPWQASSAKARLQNGKLTIDATYMDTTGGKVKRDQLTLSVADFKGPGEYSTGASGSRFIGVGFDTGAAKDAAADEQAATKAVGEMLSGASHLMLMNAKVTVTDANATEISGTFSWQPMKGMKQPAIENGTFRALIAK